MTSSGLSVDCLLDQLQLSQWYQSNWIVHFANNSEFVMCQSFDGEAGFIKCSKCLLYPPIHKSKHTTAYPAFTCVHFILVFSSFNSQTTSLNVPFPSVPSPLHLLLFSLLSHSFIHSFILSLLPCSGTPADPFISRSVSLFSPSLPGLIRGPHTPSPHLRSGNWRWDCFGGEEEARGWAEFDCLQPCKLDCQNFMVVSIILWIKADTS